MKIVYFLGAGFSKEAGVPLQSGIIPSILDERNSHYFDPDHLQTLKQFLGRVYGLQPQYHDSFTLEDIFTPIDRCISENVPLRNIPVSQLKNTRETLYHLIGQAIKRSLENKRNEEVQTNYINHFCDHLISIAKERLLDPTHKKDNISVISTNWDITVDVRLHQKLKEFGFSSNKRLPKAVVDYCCPISSWNEYDDSIKPGLEVIGSGGFSVKVLKIHGSLNWAKCPRCLRTYVDFDQKIAMRANLELESCRHCNKNYGKDYSGIGLTSDLIMPTYLKDFSNAQYKLIWQNAGIELSEADRIVFIGYSLPEADFEIRQLLRRMVRNNAEIVCVTGGTSPENTFKKYRNFFGREIQTHGNGASEYILTLPT